jgi:hypothetical protein
MRFPFGYAEREVIRHPEALKESTAARQRGFDKHHNADGCLPRGIIPWPEQKGAEDA